MKNRPTPDVVPATLNSELSQRLYELQEERRRVRNARWRTLLLWAVLLSLLFHICLMLYLHFLNRDRQEEAPQVFQVEIATLLPDEQLTELPESDLQEPNDRALSALDDLLDQRQASELEADTASAELEITGVGATPTIGGAGAGGGVQGIGGSGAAGSFFGITTTGRRFAYIVDISGSMSGGSSTTRMERAKTELRRSLRALPDFAKFIIVFYNDGLVMPPDLETWKTARPSTVRKFEQWLKKLHPHGDTKPLPAFRRVFSPDFSQPDVIFFLTDGAITSMTAEDVDLLNRRGLKTVINTIAFGDDSSQALLKQIAQDSGGVYRYVSGGGGP